MKKVLIFNAIVMVMSPLTMVYAEEVAPAPVPVPTMVSAPVVEQVAPIQPMEPARFIEPQRIPQPPQPQQLPQPSQPPQLQQQQIPFQNDRQPRPMQPLQPKPFRGEQEKIENFAPVRDGGMRSGQQQETFHDGQRGFGGQMPQQGSEQNFQGRMPNQNGPQGGQNRGPDSQISSEFKAEIMKKWAMQMEKRVAQYAKKISAFEAKKVPVSVDAKEALSSFRSLIEKAKNPSEDEDVDMSETNDMMRTLDEGLRNAEVASQFPRVMKEAMREITRQNSLIKKASAKISKLKIDLSSLMESWKQDVADMTAMKDDAQKTYDAGEVDDAVQMLRGDFFDLSRDANEKGRTFDMVSNIQQMIKGADKDIKTFTSQIAKLKKKGKDVSELENIISSGKSKLAELKTVITSGDTDKMIEVTEELNGLKMDFEEAYYGITGQSAYGAFGQTPSMPSLQGGMSTQQNPQFFDPSGGNSMPQKGGQTCNVNGIEMPGSCKDIEKKMNSQDQGASIYKTFQGIIDWFKFGL